MELSLTYRSVDNCDLSVIFGGLKSPLIFQGKLMKCHLVWIERFRYQSRHEDSSVSQ